MKIKLLLLTGVASAFLSLAACDSKEPGEDSVATVNGYEVTVSELNHEITESGIQDTANPAARAAALQAIINRRLLADMAKENELDRTPDYILKDQRMRDVLMADAAVRSLAPPDTIVNKDDVAAFLKDNLGGGQVRTIYVIDGLQFARPTKPAIMDQLTASNSFTEVATILRDAKIPAKAARLNWDSASMPTELVRQLNKLPGNEPFMIPEGNMIVAGVIRGRQTQPLTAQQANTIAQTTVTQQSARTRVTNWLEQARVSAKISYADGFAPDAIADAPKQPSTVARPVASASGKTL